MKKVKEELDSNKKEQITENNENEVKNEELRCKSGYKITELGEIPIDWKVETLGNIGEFKNGLNKGKEDFGFGYKFVNIQDAYVGNVVNTDKLERINANEKEADIYSLYKGDIVLVRSSVKPEGVGYPILYNSDAEQVLYCGFMIRFRYDINRYTPKYMLYQFRSSNVRKRILDLSTVSANTNINQDSLKQVKILIAPLKEQEKIALTLSSVDEQIEITDNLIEKTKELKKGLMQKLLTKGIGHSRFKDTEIGRIPEEWKVKTIGEVATFQGGYAFKSSNYVDSGIKLVKITNVQQNKLVWDDMSYLSEEFINKYSEYKLNYGDVVMAMTRPIISTGIKVCMVKDKDLPSLLNQRVGRFIVNSKLDNGYLYQYAFSNYFINKVNELSSTTGQPNVSSKQVESILIPVPEIQEQKQISLILTSVDEQIDQYESKKEKLQELKKGLMQKLLTGKIRVKVN